MRMWNIHNFPTYGLLVGYVTKGHIGCPMWSQYKILIYKEVEEDGLWGYKQELAMMQSL